MEIPEAAVGANRRIIDLAILLANHTGEDNPSDCCLRRDTVRDNIAGLMARIRELEQAIRQHQQERQSISDQETDLALWAVLDAPPSTNPVKRGGVPQIMSNPELRNSITGSAAPGRLDGPPRVKLVPANPPKEPSGDVDTAARQLLDALDTEPLDEPLTPRTRTAIDRLRAMLPNT